MTEAEFLKENLTFGTALLLSVMYHPLRQEAPFLDFLTEQVNDLLTNCHLPHP